MKLAHLPLRAAIGAFIPGRFVREPRSAPPPGQPDGMATRLTVRLRPERTVMP